MQNIYEGDDNIKKFYLILTIFIFLIPFNINAYSKFIYAGGESIGIELKSNYVLVVGSYHPKENKDIKVGDKIIEINGEKVNNTKDLTNLIKGKKEVEVTFIRDNKIQNKTLKIEYKDGIYKTGLYVKDSIMGIGTLTYIDPITKIFGSLGHEIKEKITKNLFDSNSGTIFSSNVHKIIKSKTGEPGEKVATFDFKDIKGNINKNSETGVYGVYSDKIDDKDLYEVASKNEIKLGEAIMLTTIDNNNVESFKINIIKIINKDNNHDILFEITDKQLLNKANGIVQGMSGSPIIQNDKIIGAVTHVIVDNPIRGYGISIEKMLIEGEN